jgi:hypothetical protein
MGRSRSLRGKRLLLFYSRYLTSDRALVVAKSVTVAGPRRSCTGFPLGSLMERDCRSTSLHTHRSIGLGWSLYAQWPRGRGLFCVAHAGYRESDSEKPPPSRRHSPPVPTQTPSSLIRSDLKSVPRRRAFLRFERGVPRKRSEKPSGRGPSQRGCQLWASLLGIASLALTSGHRFARPQFWASLRSPSVLGIASLALTYLPCVGRVHPFGALRSGPRARLAQIMPFSCIIFAGIGCSTSQCSTRMPSSARKMSITLSSCSTGRLRPIFTCKIT